jgi:hypothetical protein
MQSGGWEVLVKLLFFSFHHFSPRFSDTDAAAAADLREKRAAAATKGTQRDKMAMAGC